MTYLLAALGAVALYFLVILPWRHRHEDSADVGQRLRAARDADASRPSPPPTGESVPEHERVEAVVSAAEARALWGDEEESEPIDEGAPPPWPSEAANPADLEPVVALHTSDVGLAMLLMLHLQSEGIAYQEQGQVWASRRILVPRRHQNDVRRILEGLRRDVESSGGAEDG